MALDVVERDLSDVLSEELRLHARDLASDSVARLPYVRIVEILECAPNFVHRDTPRPRQLLQRTVGSLTDMRSPKGTRRP